MGNCCVLQLPILFESKNRNKAFRLVPVSFYRKVIDKIKTRTLRQSGQCSDYYCLVTRTGIEPMITP